MKDTGITAILLAGGRGSRMNYQDKAWVEYGGKPLLLNLIDRIEQDVDQILISRNATNPAEKNLPYLIVRDNMSDYQGPLAGIASCTKLVETGSVLVLPCDMPILPENLIPKLISGLIDSDIAVATSHGKVQPLVFTAKTQKLDSISTYLESGKRSVMGWLSANHFVKVDFDKEVFVNINELAQLD